jgi:hypothetical protein
MDNDDTSIGYCRGVVSSVKIHRSQGGGIASFQGEVLFALYLASLIHAGNLMPIDNLLKRRSS